MPSTGSTIQTRSACTRDTSSTASSDSTASSGRSRLQPVEDQHVGPLVAGVAEVVRVVEADLLAHREQQFSGVGGHLGGQRRIGQAHQNAGHGMGRRRSGVGITGLSSSATVLACSASTSRPVMCAHNWSPSSPRS